MGFKDGGQKLKFLEGVGGNLDAVQKGGKLCLLLLVVEICRSKLAALPDSELS